MIPEAQGRRWALEPGDEVLPGRTAIRRLGTGERFETYLAWDERRLALVVVKLVRPHLAADGHSLRRLAAEAGLLERLRHPVIVRGLEADLEGPRPHVVLEHLEGPRLSRLVRRHGRLEPEQLVPLGAQLAAALHYMAAEGVAHLDVKPANVIMAAPARLIDLSIAREVTDLPGVTARLGTVAYMSPEQLEPGERGPLTTATDVWGMGATLYHAAAGRPAFEAPRRRDGPFAQLAGPPEPLPSSVPTRVASLVMACMEPLPADRPTPAAVAAELEEQAASMRRRPVLGRFRVRGR
ncbi:serine/threonine-protein kinase [Miltoncostaea marina]|uniref:serine/threonine-protein kinase n=1 Tax=Miltoncostaea marina TaxID=2843215 RepID=UPI001C3E6093|nr:serine/threonine-protein kinase [Miltoncostaea marina]